MLHIRKNDLLRLLRIDKCSKLLRGDQQSLLEIKQLTLKQIEYFVFNLKQYTILHSLRYVCYQDKNQITSNNLV